MANNKSDHDKPFLDINQFIPEVYRSGVGTSVFDVAFNRHLTKDDTARVTGFIGESNAAATVDRRIKEETPHRQAFQLAPTMVATVGTEQTALSFKAFQQQLTLMGVDVNRIDQWGSTLQFNWVPPINIDMLINYQDYYWRPVDPTAQPQYLTIENRCNKATSKVNSYENMLIQQGVYTSVSSIDHLNSELLVEQNRLDLFIPGFIFYTKGSSNINMQDKYWTVVSATYDTDLGQTRIKVVETGTTTPLAQLFVSDLDAETTGLGSFIGEWYYNTATNQLKEWTGSAWIVITTAIILIISLEERLQEFRAAANCACGGDLGWDIALWDDNGNWTPVSSTTAPSSPATEDLWYDTGTDELKQWNGAAWIVLASSVSTTPVGEMIQNITENAFWDQNTTCAPQQLNQWSTQNQWVHKSEITSSSGVKRAQLPILEYDSNLELNEWISASYVWKYRAEPGQSFTPATARPSRIELEPIKGYYATYDGTNWVLYLFHTESTMCRDVDYSDTFVPGYRFRITNDNSVSNVYTVSTVEYREITSSDTAQVQLQVGTNVMCTIITIEESTFTSIQIAGDNADVLHTRIEPIQTATGDTWRGYHAHWVLDDQSTTFTPVKHQRWNLYRERSFDETTALTPGIDMSADFSAGVRGVAHIEYTVGTPGVTSVILPDTLIYKPATPQMFATPNSNEVRVYINDVRQYGTYTEQTLTDAPNYTVIGQTSYPVGSMIEFVTGVTFNQPLVQFDVVRIEVGAAPFNCMGNTAIPVRTIEDEVEFTVAAASGTQPVYRSMTQCYQVEQSKTSLNQYPLFNIFDVATSEVVAANATFGFKEDPEASVNASIQRRIAASSDGREYVFEQYLVDRDDNIMFAYKNGQTVTTYWHSPLLNKTFHWDGYAWTDRVLVNVTTGIAVRRIITSAVQPDTTIEQSIWFDTIADKLYFYVSGTWVEQTTVDIEVNGTDPMLRTVWRHGPVDVPYVPAYVDAVLAPTVEGDPEGDWEVVDQWMYNSEHANHKEVKYSQLITHFRTILDQQPKIPGLQGGGIYTLSQEQFNYGIGGTIKEHNDAFDTLISAVNVTNVTPLGIIDFAATEYDSCIIRTRDIFNRHIVDLMSAYGRETFYDPASTISEAIIGLYELNDHTAQLYSDSHSYDATTDTGIKHWISTIPMFGLGPKYRPHISVDGTSAHVFHHDGHRSTITFSQAEHDRFARALCTTPDNRVTNGTLGIISSNALPTTEASYLSSFGGTEIRPGTYWYSTTGSRKLYRMEAFTISAVAPSIYDSYGNELLDGVMYFNKSDDTAYVKDGTSWTALGLPGDITALWKDIKFAEVFGNVILEIETRLYEVTPDLDIVFDYSSLTTTPEDQATYDAASEHRFTTYVTNRDITAPLVNVDYTASDAFTWNYSSGVVLGGDGPRGDTPIIDIGSWQGLYTQLYGTPYPHLEPWKLQGFNDKPTWWDEEYADVTGTRRWDPTMWTHILAGLTPFDPTMTAPTYNYVSVNTTNDTLIPPFSSTLTAAPDRSLFTTDAQVPASTRSADYTFGEIGPTEWEWSVSNQSPYDLLYIAFVMEPAKFLHASFGPVYTLVDELQVDVSFKQVYSHEDALFHGDIYNANEQYLVRGMNQWYVNYNRYTGFDTNTEFRELWAGWNPLMTYQFGGIIDTSSFEISNKYFDVTDQDYSVILANSGVIKDLWADAFEVSLITIPPAVIQYNNQALWKMEIDSLAAIPRSIKYYGVRHYPTTVTVSTNTFSVSGVSLPWQTGDVVVMSSSKFVPAPLKPETAYYFIRLSSTTYRLAETYQDALNNNAITITAVGDGVVHVSELESSFNVFGGMGNTSELWFHYAVDKTDIRSYTPPMVITGMQTLINLIDGYAAYQVDSGVVNAGTEANDFDPVTGRLVDWALETERFIDWAYGLRQSRIRITDRYDVSANTATDELTFTGMTPHWLSGTAVSVSTTGSLPAPLIAGAVYYTVSTGVPGVIKLSTTSNILDTASHIDITSVGSGQVSIGLYDAKRTYPRFELNPYRNNVWIDTPLGVLSNVIEGPYSDIRVQQTIFDQYSRPVDSSQVVVYRHDKQSRIAARPAMPNDVDPIYKDDPYNYIHIGGGHFFVEGYEHFLVFNNYTSGGALLYDPFLGLRTQRFNLDYLEKEDYALRPTLGGYYLIDGQFERNIEGSAGDMQLYYDMFGPSEASGVGRRARALLGYKGRSSFLDLLNVNSKTQFLFYRGMIQSKGSVNSVKAYINSRRFVDAKLDDFWAWKIAEYGDSGVRVYPEINLFAEDGLLDDVRLEFLAQSEYETDPDVVDAIDKGFQIVSFSHPERWNGFPEQKAEIVSPLFLDAEVTSLTTVYAGDDTDLGKFEADYWYDTFYGETRVYNGAVDDDKTNPLNWTTTGVDQNKIIVRNVDVDGATDVVYFTHDVVCDDVRVIRKTFDATTPESDADYTTLSLVPGEGNDAYHKVNSTSVRFNLTAFSGILQIFTINAAKSKISPAKLIDKKASTVVQQVPIWDPAKGHHSHVAAHNVDLYNAVDPATYGFELNPTDAETNFWNQEEEGTIWLDTSFLNYLPYYDDKVYPSVNDRLYSWGKLAPYGDVKVYRWTKSTTAPADWAGEGAPRALTFVRTRSPAVDVSIDDVTDILTTSPLTSFTAGDRVVFVQGDTIVLPTGIEPSYSYEVMTTGTTFQIKDPSTDLPVDFTDAGANLSIIKEFDDEKWEEHTQIVENLSATLLSGGVTPPITFPIVFAGGDSITWIPSNIAELEINGSVPVDTTVDVYKNGVLVQNDVPVTAALPNLEISLTNALSLEECDTVTVVRRSHVPTTEELDFDPNVEDDGTVTTQWTVDYNYSTSVLLTNPNDRNSTATTRYYYFWTEGSTIRDTTKPSAISPVEIATQLRDIPTPHLIVQRPKDDPRLIERYGYGVSPYEFAYSLGVLSESSYEVPVLYREAIIRGVASYVTDDDRYIVRFTRDFTLRDDLRSGSTMLKNKHQEWQLFREAQMSTLPRELWDRLTEALIKYKLTDSSVRVPSLERELFDVTYGTDTQYGLGVDQTFVESSMGLATVIAYLKDANNDFSPTDIDNFFSTHDFTTPEGITLAMNDIYTSFNATHVNSIWFNTLHDSMSLRAKYKELMKTSWIALHGIRVLEVGGLFDD